MRAYVVAGLLVLLGLTALVVLEQQADDAMGSYRECVDHALRAGVPLDACR